MWICETLPLIYKFPLLSSSAESIMTLKNRESIHFGFLLRGFVEKESIHDTWIDSLLFNDT